MAGMWFWNPSSCNLETLLMEGLKWTFSSSARNELTTDLTWLVKSRSRFFKLIPALAVVGASVCPE